MEHRFTASSIARAGSVAGLVAAAVELVPILIIQALLGISPVQVFQSIASGLQGADAYREGMGSAALGVALHVAISVVAGCVFAGASTKLPLLRVRPAIAGMLFGVAAYIVMSYVVLPLSAVAFPAATDPRLIAMSLAVHIFAFGLPIGLVVHRMTR